PSATGKYPAPGGLLTESVGFFFVPGHGLVEEPLEEDRRVAALRELEGERHLAAAAVELVVGGRRGQAGGGHQGVAAPLAEERLRQLLEAELALLDLLLLEDRRRDLRDLPLEPLRRGDQRDRQLRQPVLRAGIDRAVEDVLPGGVVDLVSIGQLADDRGERAVPEPALVGRHIEDPEVLVEPLEREPERAGMAGEVARDRALGRHRKILREAGPVAPAVPHQDLEVAVLLAVLSRRRREREPERLLVLPADEGAADELAVRPPQRAEPLVVEVVRDAGPLHGREVRNLDEVAHGDLEPVAVEARARDRIARAAEELDTEGRALEGALRAAADRDRLLRPRVAVLEPA